MLFGAIRLLEYILLIMEHIDWVSRWFVLKKNILSKCFCYGVSRSLLLYNVCCFVPSAVERQDWAVGATSDLILTMLTRYIRWMVSFVDTICYVSKIIWQKNIIYWYLIILVLIIHECYYSCLVFFFTGKLNQILTHSRASGNTWFKTWFQSGYI